jgi:hypothetical protein
MMARTIKAMSAKVSIVLTTRPGATGRGPGEPIELGLWAQLPEMKLMLSATVTARPEAIRIDPSFVSMDCRER